MNQVRNVARVVHGCFHERFHDPLSLKQPLRVRPPFAPQLTMAHHVVSILATVASMIEWLPHAAALFAFGAFTLECGSLVNSVRA